METASRIGDAAIDYARGRVGTQMPAAGYCLQFTRQCFNIPSKYASAIDAWNAAQTRRSGDRYPPKAVPVWFRTPSVYDHVAFWCGSDRIVTTFNADIREYSGNAIARVERDFNGTYLGWAYDLNAYSVDPGTNGADVDEPPTWTSIGATAMPVIIRNGSKYRILSGDMLSGMSGSSKEIELDVANAQAAGIPVWSVSNGTFEAIRNAFVPEDK